VNYQVRPGFLEKPNDVVFFDQVVVGAAWNENLDAVVCSQPFNYKAAEKARAAGNDNSLIRKLSAQSKTWLCLFTKMSDEASYLETARRLLKCLRLAMLSKTSALLKSTFS
jgi:hypothetical protein